jgi:type VI secretion system protein ImpJ
MTPLAIYTELCRIAGQLAIFLPARRPGTLSAYNHDDLGTCFARVIFAINRGLEAAVLSDFEMHYFQEQIDPSPRAPKLDRLRVDFDPAWRTSGRSIYLGIEGVETELGFHECQALIGAIDMKVGGATKVDSYFQGRLKAIQLVPVTPDRPRALPPGFVYYRIEAEPQDWQDVVQTRTMILRFNPAHVEPGGTVAPASASDTAAPRVVRVLKVAARDGDPSRKISFALFIA